MKRDPYEQEIIDNIRRFRQAKGLTQEELGRRCNMPTGYIGGIETYKRFPKVKNLKRIAEGLELDIAFLMSPHLARRYFAASDVTEDFRQYVKRYFEVKRNDEFALQQDLDSLPDETDD
jgi:transcriptional regulator with XRE-family HTH domain